MKEALESAAIYGAEVVKNSSQYMKRNWAGKNI